MHKPQNAKLLFCGRTTWPQTPWGSAAGVCAAHAVIACRRTSDASRGGHGKPNLRGTRPFAALSHYIFHPLTLPQFLDVGSLHLRVMEEQIVASFRFDEPEPAIRDQTLDFTLCHVCTLLKQNWTRSSSCRRPEMKKQIKPQDRDGHVPECTAVPNGAGREEQPESVSTYILFLLVTTS
jgi:hypothetical protein